MYSDRLLALALFGSVLSALAGAEATAATTGVLAHVRAVDPGSGPLESAPSPDTTPHRDRRPTVVSERVTPTGKELTETRDVPVSSLTPGLKALGFATTYWVSVTCTATVDDPHPSHHVPGTVNVVIRSSCTQSIPMTWLKVSLHRLNGSSYGVVSVSPLGTGPGWPKQVETNAAFTTSCAFWWGFGDVVWFWPNGDVSHHNIESVHKILGC